MSLCRLIAQITLVSLSIIGELNAANSWSSTNTNTNTNTVTMTETNSNVTTSTWTQTNTCTNNGIIVDCVTLLPIDDQEFERRRVHCPQRLFEFMYGRACDYRVSELRYVAIPIRHAYFGGGFPQGVSLKRADAINDNSDIVGQVDDAAGTTHAVRVNIGPQYPDHHYFSDLGALGTDSVARGINNIGTVIGGVRHNRRMMPAIWHSQLGGLRVLDVLPNMKRGYAIATSFNSYYTEYVTGYVVEPNDGREVGFVWQYDGQTERSEVFGDAMDRTTPHGINDNRIVVGWVDKPNEGRQAFMWQTGPVALLGNLGGRSLAYDINNNASPIIVGTAWQRGGIMTAFSWQNGVLSPLPALPNAKDTRAFALTDGGDIVGKSDDHAVIWRGRVMYDLNDVLDNDIDTVLTQAIDINRHGRIVVQGGDGIYYVLIPAEERAVRTGP